MTLVISTTRFLKFKTERFSYYVSMHNFRQSDRLSDYVIFELKNDKLFSQADCSSERSNGLRQSGIHSPEPDENFGPG